MQHAELDVRLLSAGPFVTMIDRFAGAPVLIPIAVDFHAPVGAVAIAATAYYLAYGLAQPFWGFASDRAGRIKVIRISLAATAVACTLSALAPNLDFLIATRIIAGASVCAVLPTALVYIGDVRSVQSPPRGHRRRARGGRDWNGRRQPRRRFFRALLELETDLCRRRCPGSDPRGSHGPPAGVGRAALDRRSIRAAAAGCAQAVGAVPDSLRDSGGCDGARVPRVFRTGARVDRNQFRSSRSDGRHLWRVGARGHASDQARRFANPCVGTCERWRGDGTDRLPCRGRGPARRCDSLRERDDRRRLLDLPFDDAGVGDGHRTRGARNGCGIGS